MAEMYLSFVGSNGFLGAAVVEAEDIVDAAGRCWDLGINPGGEVLCIPSPDGTFREEDMNRLLTRDEAINLQPKDGV